MSPQRIFYIAFFCLLLILSTQAYLVYDYFQTTHAGLVRESDTILQEAFKSELNFRHKKFKYLIGEQDVVIPPPPSKENTVKVNFSTNRALDGNILSALDLAVHKVVSDLVPLNMACLDSITDTILKARKISSDFTINLVDKETDKGLLQSEEKYHSSMLKIPSKLMVIDYDKNESLQLILINPFGIIIRRMGLMLLSSIALAVLCMFAFRFLLRVLARQKQLVAFKNEFLGTIAHELKRPVASLAFNLDCLSLPTSAANKLQHELLLSRSVGATMELNATINMIVALTKLEEGLQVLNKEPVSLNQMFEELKNKFVSYAAKKVEIQMVYDADEILLKADANLLNQCFANLIDNAIKYSDNEVLIIINIRKTGQWILVSIKDNGYGISAEKLPAIFEKYNRAHTHNTKINGFGIGLNYVKTIVEKHKGEVDVTSHEGEGSEFSILLPA